MEPILMARIAVLLAGCTLAAFTDIRTGLILDKITYPMIAIAVVLNLVEFNWLFLLIGAATFAAGYAVYYAGKLGGGDVKLFAAIAFLLPLYQEQLLLLTALFAAALLAVAFYAAYFVSKYVRQGIDWRENRESAKRAAVFGLVVAAYFLALLPLMLVSFATIAFLAFPLFLALLFMAFEKGIRHRFFLKQVNLDELDEDEVIAADFLDGKIKQGLNLRVKGVFGKKEIERLRETGVKAVPVYRGMPPFAPFILLGCIAALLQPDLIGFLFM